jgi:hypothetical protein
LNVARLTLISILMLSAGCAASKDQRRAGRAVEDYFIGNYTAARQQLRPLAQKTNENFVLNNVRRGSAALVD